MIFCVLTSCKAVHVFLSLNILIGKSHWLSDEVKIILFKTINSCISLITTSQRYSIDFFVVVTGLSLNKNSFFLDNVK